MTHNIIVKCSNPSCGSCYIAECNDFKTVFKEYLEPRGWIKIMDGDLFMEFCCESCKEQYYKWHKTELELSEDNKLKEECKCDRCNGLGYIRQEYLNKRGITDIYDLL